ncbi:MAG: penicillin-binding protein activator LpoB [bacterium]|nr:penicillin-binding protein activator LpoB [bacterium]
MINKIFIISLSAALLFGCASTKITRMESNEIVDLSGDWNDADSQITSQALVNSCLGSYWREEFMEKKGKKPVVIVGMILNRSQEHINTQTITKDLETALVNSGRIKFVASSTERQELRSEKDDQATFSSQATKKAKFQETGADFMLKGQINTIFDELGKESVKYYQVELELINIKTNEKVWIGQKKIKKLVKKRKRKF